MGHISETWFYARRQVWCAAAVLLLVTCGVSIAHAQSTYSNVIMTAPVADAVDENFVSVLSGKLHFSIPAVKLGDVSFTTFTTNEFFTLAADDNYGKVIQCYSPNLGAGNVATTECSSAAGSITVQAVLGEERATFYFNNPQAGQYSSEVDGSTFVDNGTTCVWTKRDGTQIVFFAFHAPSNPLCLSNNISKIIHPDGRIETYYYYGSLSTSSNYTPSPILSIATNSGYLLKYNYTGTPTWGAENSVTAINRAFETCDPAAVSCTLANPWPTATLAWTTNSFTLIDEANKTHVFGLDSWGHVSSYQPPGATSPVYYYSICTLAYDGHTMTNCFGYTYWTNNPSDPNNQTIQLLWDLVQSSTRNGQTWNYGMSFTPGSYPYGWSVWGHSVYTPLGTQMLASGNATPGMEGYYGPIDYISHYDGTVDHFNRDLQNYLHTRQTPGVLTTYSYSAYGNLLQITKGSPAVTQSATYPTTCTSFVTCFKPISLTDGNSNTANYTYDPVHGGVLTATGPAVNTSAASGVHPQTRYSYVQRNAWYLSSSGVMTRDSNPIWVLASESTCRMGAPAAGGSGCALANDEVVTTYEYGADSGPNNLILRGQSLTADGQTLRTCYGHDKQGNKIWETSPNAQPTSCLSY